LKGLKITIPSASGPAGLLENPGEFNSLPKVPILQGGEELGGPVKYLCSQIHLLMRVLHDPVEKSLKWQGTLSSRDKTASKPIFSVDRGTKQLTESMRFSNESS